MLHRVVGWGAAVIRHTWALAGAVLGSTLLAVLSLIIPRLPEWITVPLGRFGVAFLATHGIAVAGAVLLLGLLYASFLAWVEERDKKVEALTLQTRTAAFAPAPPPPRPVVLEIDPTPYATFSEEGSNLTEGRRQILHVNVRNTGPSDVANAEVTIESWSPWPFGPQSPSIRLFQGVLISGHTEPVPVLSWCDAFLGSGTLQVKDVVNHVTTELDVDENYNVTISACGLSVARCSRRFRVQHDRELNCIKMESV